MGSSVKTNRVAGRRELHFQGLSDILADVERLAASPRVETLGNWSGDQILRHLATVMEKSIDGFDNRLPAAVQFVVSWLFKRRFLTKPMPAGYKLTGKVRAELVPQPTDWQDGLARIRRAIARLQAETQRVRHPALGQMSVDQWNTLHCRHAELHLSFLVPRE